MRVLKMCQLTVLMVATLSATTAFAQSGSLPLLGEAPQMRGHSSKVAGLATVTYTPQCEAAWKAYLAAEQDVIKLHLPWNYEALRQDAAAKFQVFAGLVAKGETIFPSADAALQAYIRVHGVDTNGHHTAEGTQVRAVLAGGACRDGQADAPKDAKKIDRMMAAMFKMQKLDVAALQKAFDGK